MPSAAEISTLLTYARVSETMNDNELLDAIHSVAPQPLLDRDIQVCQTLFAGHLKRPTIFPLVFVS